MQDVTNGFRSFIASGIEVSETVRFVAYDQVPLTKQARLVAEGKLIGTDQYSAVMYGSSGELDILDFWVEEGARNEELLE